MIQGPLKRPKMPLEVPSSNPFPLFKPWLPLSHKQSVLLLSTELAVLVGRHKLTLYVVSGTMLPEHNVLSGISINWLEQCNMCEMS